MVPDATEAELVGLVENWETVFGAKIHCENCGFRYYIAKLDPEGGNEFGPR